MSNFYPYAAQSIKALGSYTFSGEQNRQVHAESLSAYPVEELYSLAVSAMPGIGNTSRRPLRVSHIGPSFVCAGVESWLRALSSHCDPKLVQFVHNVVTEDYAVDYELLRQIGIPFSFGRDDAVRSAALDSDIVLVWGNVSPKDLRPPGSTAKVIFVAHGVGDWTRAAFEMCRPATDHVVAVTNAVRKAVPCDRPTSVILNGVDQRHIVSRRIALEVKRALGFSDSDYVVGFVGRFSPEKQAHLVIEAVQAMPHDTKLLLLGWGALRYQLMDLCNELIPGRFAFAASREFLGDYYQIMSALCMPSAEEGFGLVAAEAMLHGVPVICTSVGVASELIEHRINGLIAAPDEISSCLLQLRNNPEWARGVGQEGRRTASRYCLASTMAAQYQNLFYSITKTT